MKKPSETKQSHKSTMMDIPVAAIVHAYRDAVDGLLADFALSLKKRGWCVRGVVQQCHGEGKENTVLIELDNGLSFPLFQKLGAGSSSCSVAPGSIAAASVMLRRALHDGADLVIANRFGALEANGGGFADEMLALMSEQRPLLTVVADAYLRDWRSFTGGCGVELQATLPALEAWFAKVSDTRERQCA
jgi:hypothetical protein